MLFCKLWAVVTSCETTKAWTGGCSPKAEAIWLVPEVPKILNDGDCAVIELIFGLAALVTPVDFKLLVPLDPDGLVLEILEILRAANAPAKPAWIIG